VNVDESNHTKHCAVCGSDNDITTKHNEINKVTYEIFYDGFAYSGYQYTCECGYQWIAETDHNFIYSYENENEHRIECVLGSTEYCAGFESYLNEHTEDEIVLADNNEHHVFICVCGYTKEEACDFTEYSEEDEETGEINWYCRCGNAIVESD
jgi:hypothetical protein